MASKIYLIGPSGGVFSDTGENLQGRLAEGYRVASPAEVEQERNDLKYGGSAMAVPAAISGIARGATGGLIDPLVVKGLGAFDEELGERARKALKGLKAAHAGPSAVGEFVGIVSPLGAIGKAGWLAKGASALPSALTARVATKIAGEKVAGETLKRAMARGAIREGIEGAAYGAGFYASQSALEAQEMTAEGLLFSGLQGGALGVGVGVGLPIAGRGLGWLGRGAKKGVDAIAKMRRADLDAMREVRTELQIGHDLRQTVTADARATAEAKTFAKAEAKAESAVEAGAKDEAAELADVMDLRTPIKASDQDIFDALISSGEVGKEAARTLRIAQHDTSVGGTLNEIVDALTVLKNQLGDVAPLMMGGEKWRSVAGVMKRGNELDNVAATFELLEVMRRRAETMLSARSGRGLGTSHNKRLVKGIQGTQRRLREIVESGGDSTNAQLHNRIDVLKRDVGKINSWAKKKARDVHPLITKMYEDLRVFLESEKHWGAAGVLQKEVNGPWASLIDVDHLTGRGRGRLWSKALRPEDAQGAAAWKEYFEADRKKVGPLLRNITSADNVAEFNIIRKYAERSNAFANAVGKHSKSLDSGLTGANRAIAEASVKLDRALKKAEHIMRHKDVHEQVTMGATRGRGLLGAVSSVLTGGVGLRMTGNIKQALDQAASGTAEGGVSVGLVQTLGAVGAAQAIRSRALADAFSGAIPQRIARTVKSIARNAKAGAVPFAAANLDYVKKQREVEDGQIMRRAEAAADLSEAALPATTEIMLQRAQAAQDYLLRNLPTAYGDTTVPSKAEVERFNRVAMGALNPMSLLKDIASGVVSSDKARAVKEVWPATYDSMRNQLTQMVIELRAQRKKLPYPEALALAQAFDIVADKTLEPAVMKIMQSGYSRQAEEQKSPPPRGKPFDISSEYETASEKLEAGA